MNEEKDYKVGECWKFALKMPDGRNFFFAGEVKETQPERVRIRDEKTNTEVIVDLRQLVFAQRLNGQPSGQAGRVGQ